MLIEEFKKNGDTYISKLKERVGEIRTGRTTPALIENIVVTTYSGQAKLKLTELASISISSPTSLTVAPFDQSTIQDIEKAIMQSPLHLTPRTQGNLIIINIPPLSEEQRKKINKVLGEYIENTRVQIRKERDNTRKRIKKMLEDKEISEDKKFSLEKEIDKATQELNQIVEEIKQKKEKEILSI